MDKARRYERFIARCLGYPVRYNLTRTLCGRVSTGANDYYEDSFDFSRLDITGERLIVMDEEFRDTVRRLNEGASFFAPHFNELEARA